MTSGKIAAKIDNDDKNKKSSTKIISSTSL